MTECHDATLREQLPLLVRDALSAAEAALLRTHVARCDACASELRLLERSARLFDQATPRIDTTAIVGRLPAAPGARPRLTIASGASRPFGLRRYGLAIAASLLLFATISLGALRDSFWGTSAARGGASESGTAVVAALPVGLVGGNELSELGADDLETLLMELDQLQATVAAEPVTMQRPVNPETEDM